MNSKRLPLRLLAILAMAVVVSPSWADDVSEKVQKLIADIKNPDNTVCVYAVDELAKLGAEAEPAIPALIEALSKDDKKVCSRVARAIGALGEYSEAAVPALQKLLKDEDDAVQAYSAYALGEIGKPSMVAVDDLIDLGFDEDPLVRRAANRALRRIDPPVEKTMPHVLKILKEGDLSIIMPALHTMAEDGKAVVPRLKKAMALEPEVAYWACVILSDLGPDAVDALPEITVALDNKHPETRMQAMHALAGIGEPAQASVPKLIEMLKGDKFESVRETAAYTIASLAKPGDKAAIAALTAAMEDKDPALSLIASWGSARLDPDNVELLKKAVNHIVESFKTDDVNLRRMAARALTEFDGHEDIAAPALVAALRDADHTVVGNAIDALASLGPEVLQGISSGLADKDLRHYAVRVVYRLGPDAAVAVPELIEAIESTSHEGEEGDFVSEIQFALGGIGKGAEKAVPTLIKSLDAEHERVVSSAIFALGKIGPVAKAAVPKLEKLLDAEDKTEKRLAAWALLKITPDHEDLIDEAVPLFIEALSSERELVRIEAAMALGEMGDEAKDAIPQLRKQAESDPSEHARDAAADALKALGAE